MPVGFDVDDVVCPDCGADVAMRRAVTHDAVLREIELERGRCGTCGWERVRVIAGSGPEWRARRRLQSPLDG